MLLQLNINNFALIEKLSLCFNKGFNVLTGETGAGKSILIDAINYVLGSKFNKDLIRTGENKTYVEAVFTIETNKIKNFLEKHNIEYDDLIIISRESFQNGKTIAKINNKSVILSTLKELSEVLLDIHGQHENQNLLDMEKHIFYLDSYGEDDLLEDLHEYKIKYSDLKELKSKINYLSSNGDRENIINYLEYQIKDIEEGKFVANEEKELRDRFNILNNAEKINYSINSSYSVLYDSNDEFMSVYDALGVAIKELKPIENHLEKIKAVIENLENFYFNLEDMISTLRDIKESIVYDENELERTNRRIYTIDGYKKRYGKASVEELLELKESLLKEYEEIVNREEIIEKLKREQEILEGELQITADNLHEKRIKISESLTQSIQNELNYIGLEKSKFFIDISLENNFGENGKDKVQFLISTNPGEPLKPLERIVSGGELSRIMLALKTVFVDKDEIPTVIFDEIDTGISGRVAQSVAEKMYVISDDHQVFCVTHLPQIASMSDNHFKVAKDVVDNKTYTKVMILSEKEKEEEVARMIGGVEITKTTLENAKELINLAQNKKNKLRKHT
ncbi:MAG: DNA repair protein RecN [Clostridium sp.]|uniref:DNA repair protein RecN n=1 Tax=Clostridium sp. TaxID=1506 RepID=UPI002A882038|nr:DNA repair protein RecN [Clostridium sp.]MDY5098234.1 DNA repair protein RecN [Clostridium sp.]